jgi:hypothetical protein
MFCSSPHALLRKSAIRRVRSAVESRSAAYSSTTVVPHEYFGLTGYAYTFEGRIQGSLSAYAQMAKVAQPSWNETWPQLTANQLRTTAGATAAAPRSRLARPVDLTPRNLYP